MGMNMIGWIRREAVRLGYTIVWSVDGWRAAWATEKTLRQWTFAQIASTVVAFSLNLDAGARGLIVAFGFLMLAAELINTAVEKTIDMVQPQPHPLAKKVKDCGSAMVLLTLFAWVTVWIAALAG